MEYLKNEAFEASEASKNTSILNCIDLSSPDIQNSVSLLKQACLDSGFFYVINHGISQEFMDEVFYQSKRFFDLPISEKMKFLKNKKNRGYTPVLDQLWDPVNQLHGDFKEGYYIGVEVPESDPDAQKPFYGPNIWPTAVRWQKVIVRIIALALNLEVDYFDQQEMLGKPLATLRLLHYEGAHSDFGFITLLATDDVYGLQICKDKDAKPQKWEFVAPLKGAFIVNLADMLERMSNCIFRSTLHRVLGNGQERYSVAYFVAPNHDCLVECLPTCHSKENPPKFPPIKCETYMLQRYSTHADVDSYKK